ncbi:retrograde regulation protein 2 [Hanseniaspora osmophila]|uniref:Retrograde regulation protein 2 n=1 Tax=Hanseniaspora osmophila TaxID=56408 RepID=A0A1E5R229_9ASCO|nr:Retrograde regulation protein 2 [Hanseniaspora osmophila]
MSNSVNNTSETEVVSRNLCGVVDIGSNGIRFSISSKAAHHARIMPCVFKDRVGISLFDVQYATLNAGKAPIPTQVIKDVCAAMKRFKLICEDFGVPQTGVRVVATEATREALNSKDFTAAIEESTGWQVELLAKEEEGRIGAYGVISSFNIASGLFIDLGGGSTQLSWIQCINGEVKMSSSPVSLPYGAGALSRRMQLEDKRSLFLEIRQAYVDAVKKIGIPDDMIKDAEAKGGFDVYACGGGLRGMGHLILSRIEEYPIQTIINGFSCSFEEFESICDYLFLKGHIPGNTKIFRVSDRRAQQLPAVGLLMSAAFESLPKVRNIHFSEGGVREGSLYSILPREIRAQDPIHIASRPYAPLLASKYLALLKTAIPLSEVPPMVYNRVAPALCNLAFVHAGYPKELQSTAALHVATTGIIAGCHGLSHRIRALVGIALCERWGGDLPQTELDYKQKLEDVVLRDGDKAERQKLVWWTKYIGQIMYVICGVHPGGNIRDGVFNFTINESDDMDVTDNAGVPVSGSKKKALEVIVKISREGLKTSASVRGRIMTLQKKIRKLSKGSSQKVKVGVQYFEKEDENT